MDCRAVLIFLCMLTAQALCGTVRDGAKSGALKATIQLMQKEIQTAVDHLAAPAPLPNISCVSLNVTELVGLEQQPLTTHYLSSFRCYMLKISELTPELSSQLQIIGQYSLDVERLMSSQTAQQDCSLPPFQQDMDSYVYVRCLLQLLDQRLRKESF